MKRKYLTSYLGLSLLILIIGLFAQEFTYVGAAKCKICHKTEKQGKQYPIWEEGKHANLSRL